ncbi:MAG: ABC-2 transporter permease [Paenibacillus lautus]|jgi:ABC-type transport system involved in multi-copper enzyme maturation permease subunit|uniref:ABC-2 transporter permease n=1 Tax=Paenibacillus lautus TaxID=1401 RepID=UPI0026EEACE8|nr:ABC-2 transporter permease [Paenibacillus lautus]MCI1774978.1 ABC-2 transporter permease [Paenibacillus lautus]
MLNLLRKDFIALKSSLWMILMYLAVFSIAFIPSHDMSIYLVGIYTAFASISLATMIDIKNHNHHFLVTLPISRKHIVQAKYIAAIVLMLFAVLASYGLHWLVNLLVPELNKPNFALQDILIQLVILLVLVSIYMPLFYALSKKGAGVINAIFLISLIVLGRFMTYFIQMMSEGNMVGDQLLFIIPIVILLMFIASYYLTIKLFTRKDL